ncbi:ras GEF [Phellopilus nigrolimitatus]|nr:ras GEF [Phellopilus nigrolimitatus]
MAATATMVFGVDRAANAVEEDTQTTDDGLLPTFYCRALYDYQSTDGSSLSFYRGDIIEVLTQLESGWWDGLLGEERGWFPSNYVQPSSARSYAVRANEVHDSAIDVSQRVRAANSEQDRDWLQEEMDYAQTRNGFEDLAIANGVGHAPGASNDFWLPQVDPSGQIFYMNTQTGERSRDLPTETGDGHGNVLNELSSPTNSRAASRAGALNQYAGRLDNFSSTSNQTGSSHQAGFGITRRGGTPEPWTKRLADDGMTYYYFNKITGQIQWTPPAAAENGMTAATVGYADNVQANGRRFGPGGASIASGYTSHASTNDTVFTESRLRADSMTSQNQSSSKRESVYSDDSDIQPREIDVPDRPPRANGAAGFSSQGRNNGFEDDHGMTPAERAALQLQETLATPEPESIDKLSDLTRDAIIVVMASVDDDGLPKGPDHDKKVEQDVTSVVVAVRNLLYVSCALSGPLPNALGERNSGDPSGTAVAQQLQAQLKTSQRKVTATLSKLVLSARAARYKREAFSADMMIRVEQDAADLQRAVDNFVSEVKKQYSRTVIKQLHQRVGRKRLRGIFDLQHIGPGLPGAGVGASWKGFGFIDVDEGLGVPKRSLNDETISEAKILIRTLDDRLAALVEMLQDMKVTSDDLLNQTQSVLADISAVVAFIVDVNICQEVDVGGLRSDQPGPSYTEDPYMQAVNEARLLLRSFETVTQSLYDDGAILLTFVQTIPFEWASLRNGRDRQPVISSLYGSARVVQSEADMAVVFLEKLLAVAREQISQESRFREAMALRISRMSIVDGDRRLSNFFGAMPDVVDESEDVVDIDFALRKGAARPAMGGIDGFPQDPVDVIDPRMQQNALQQISQNDAYGARHQKSPSMSKALPDQELVDDDIVPDIPEKGDKAGPTRATKIRQLLGEDAPERYIEIANADSKPWYLRSEHTKDDMVVNPDGGIRAGSMPALIERLTTHEYGDPVFIRTFLMTYKSFTTLNELFELLVKRFWIQPPDGLKSNELDEWTKLKQHVVRSRVLNTFKTMVTDEQVLVEDDLYILDRIKEFLLNPEVITSPAAKNLLNIIERKKQGGLKSLTLTPPTSFPPASIIPKGMNKNRLKLLDIDALELARQLTIMEFALYRKIKAIECLQRSRDQKVGEHKDHITDVIQMTNKIANWVNSTILSKEDSRKRAALVKQFISVADRCRNLHNFSSMAAIISGLNSPPIRRLKRTWEQVNGRFMSQLGTCEMTLDSTKNFTNYKATLSQTNPPCIPFIGVYLTTLTFINDGSKDFLPGNLVNFGKRQRAAEVIREIQHWQSKDFNLAPLPPILAFVEEALSSFNDSVDWGEQFWNLSLEREPREREDEKMARLLQESGFL